MQQVEALKFYIFDWDDNVLCLDSQVFIEKLDLSGQWKPTSIGTYDYGLLINDLQLKQTIRFPQDEYGENNYKKAFLNFSDLNNEVNPAFLSDCKSALSKQQYGSSFNAFKKCLIGGHLFMICTARGHNPLTIKKVVEYIIDELLSQDEYQLMLNNLQNYHFYFHNTSLNEANLIEWYLSNNFYIGVSSTYFKSSISHNEPDVSKAKGIAVDYFMKRIGKMNENFPGKINKVKVGISDDSRDNLDGIANVFKINDYGIDIEYFLYDTSKGSCGTHQYNKIKLSEYEPRRV